MATYQASHFLKVACVASHITLSSSVALLTHASKTDGQYAYNTLTVQMFSELIKICVSAFLLTFQYAFGEEIPRVNLDIGLYLRASIPGLLYFVTNNLNFYILQEIDPMAFQILNNLKILSTACLFKMMMGAQVSPLQWRMLVILVLGSIMSQMGACVGGGSVGWPFKGSTLGYSLKFCNVLLTAVATVYNEKFMKSNDCSIHFQNLQLYSFGFFFGVGACLHHFRSEAADIQVWTAGWGWVVLALTLNYAFAGIATSAVLKYLDNMTKTFSSNAAMFVVAVISIAFYHEEPTVHLFVGMSVCAVAVETYNSHAAPKPTAPPPPPLFDTSKTISSPKGNQIASPRGQSLDRKTFKEHV